jgi:hypothetical protein
MAMNTGTIALKADAGRLSNSTAPTIPPLSEATARTSTRRRWPESSCR